jgi:tRNA-2-methylthio-N6-dimethylallyladenosine synthase
MAQEHGSKFFKRMPMLDLVCGPGNLSDVPRLLSQAFAGQTKMTAIDRIDDFEYTMDHVEYRSHLYKAQVNIMSGCDHKCTYCIVPTTRGIERSRPADDIVNEIRGLVDRGFKEILLLGQNVNCYGKKLEKGIDFTRLLERIDSEARPERIRFTTSHPKDAHKRLFEAMRDLPSMCEHLHLPVQSGSNRVLKRMKREHTREWYLDRIAEYKDSVPNGSVTTDFIVGFCGETDQDFEDTLQLVRDVEYDSAFIFKYSQRPGTPASKLEDDVPEKVKNERLQALMKLQKEISMKQNSSQIGKTIEVLFENDDPKNTGRAFGRSRDFKRVVVNAKDAVQGLVRPVRIDQLLHETLIGELV